jgi:tetratricopeptide (TPR) repeat protein
MERVSIKTNPTRTVWLIATLLALTPWAEEAHGLSPANLGPASQHPPSMLQTQASSPEHPTLEQLQQRALQEGEAGKTDQAILDYQKALALEPEWKEGRWNLGSLEYGAARYDEARATFSDVVQFAPNLGMAWALLGLSEFEVKDYQDALAHLQKAQSLGILDDAEIARVSAYHLGLLLIRSGQFEQAQSFLIATFGSAPMTAQVKVALGLAALRVPLLPEEIDPEQDALILAVGEAVGEGADGLSEFAEIIKTHPDVPYLNYAYALQLVNTGQSSKAIVRLHEEIHTSPKSPLPWIELSRLHLGTPGEAMLSARQAVALAPGSREAHEALADAEKADGQIAQAKAESESAGTLSLWPAVEERITKRYAGPRKSDSDSAERSMQQAMKEYGAEQYSAASQQLRNWLTVHPEDGTALAMLGLCEFALKDFDNALIHLDRGAQLGLNGSQQSVQTAKYTFGILLIHAGHFDRATEVLIASKTGGPDDSKVKYALGLALLRRPEFPQENQADVTLISAAGEISALLQQSRYDEAIPQFKRLLGEYPAASFLHYAYGTALLALSEFDEAAAQMQAEIALTPKSELPLLRLASIALRQHRADDAVKWAQQALKLAHDSVDAHYLLGRASLEKGDIATAVQQLEIASKLSPNSPEIHFNLAKAYDHARLPEKADQERAIFVRLNSASENKRSQQGNQIYSGPHDTGAGIRPPSNASPALDAEPLALPHIR